MSITGCGLPLIRDWYAELPNEVRLKIYNTGLKPLIEGFSSVEIDNALIQALAEKWWDTTHTFHFDKFGEMTLTPKDFSAITGISIGGKVLNLDKNIHRNYDELQRLLGEPITGFRGRSIHVHCLSEAYRGLKCKETDKQDIIVHAFLLALLGSTIFSRGDSQVHLYYLASLTQIEKVSEYNWGGAGLAFMYEQMDDLCRDNTQTIGGLWRAWEVWKFVFSSCN